MFKMRPAAQEFEKMQVGDRGIDGRIFPVGTKPSDDQNMFAGDWFPIQVKQQRRVGLPDTDQFEAVMEREPAPLLHRLRLLKRFRAGMRRLPQAHRSYHQTHPVQEILDEQHVQKM
jgi:hypothetical protein